MTLIWTGQIDLEAALQKVIDGARKGIEEAAEDVLNRSNDLIPTASGELRDSGTVTKESDDGVAISYGNNGSAPYAVAQHERTELRHDDGQAKFLETAFLGGQERTAGIIGDAIRSEAGL